MGCIPSSTYPEHIPRPHRYPTHTTSPANGQSGSEFVLSRAASTTLVQTAGGNDSSGAFHLADASPANRSLCATPSLRLQGQGSVGADGFGLAATTYTTTNGRRHRFVFGRPAGFSGAEEIISCLDEGGMRGNLYRLVRSKLLSIGEEEAHAAADGQNGNGRRHSDTLSESEAKEREKGVDVLTCSVTARRHTQGRSPEAALQEQYVVALLGTDTIVDASAIPASRFRSRLAMARAKDGAADTTAGDALHLSTATLQPLSSSSSSASGAVPAGPDPAEAGDVDQLDFDSGEDINYELYPQAHYSALPAQRKPGAAVPLALCPPSRTLRVPVGYSAVEDRLVSAAATAGDKERGWREKVLPQRMFRLATSETRTWAFYNDSEYAMHVYTLFDRASKLEPRDSTRLWPSSVFDDGNAAPTPPPLFFGLFFDEEGEEAVTASEMPDSVAQRQQQHIFGTRGMWIAELLVPPRSTRMFVEGKVRGAYRMRCTQLALDDLVAVTDMAQLVAKKRNTKQAAERFRFGLRRGIRNSGSAKPAAPAAEQPNPLAATSAAERVEPERRTSSPVQEHGELPTTPPLLERSMVDSGCRSTLTESQGVLTRQTFIRNHSASPADAAAAPATKCRRLLPSVPEQQQQQQQQQRRLPPAASVAVAMALLFAPPRSAAPVSAARSTEDGAESVQLLSATDAAAASLPTAAEGGGLSSLTESGPPRSTDPPLAATGVQRSVTLSLLSPPAAPSEQVPEADSSDEDEDELSSTSGTHGSGSAEFARVRPERQRTQSVRDGELFSSPVTPTLNLGGDGAVLHRLDSAAALSLEHATLPRFLADTTTTTTPTAATDDGSAVYRVAPLRKSRGSPGAPEGLSPHIHRRRRSSIVSPTSGGGNVVVAVDGEEREERDSIPEGVTTTWQGKVHTLTPHSSYQSERFRRAGVPSISSCRTVGVDDWTESLDHDADVPVHDSSVSVNAARTIPYLREMTQAGNGDE